MEIQNQQSSRKFIDRMTGFKATRADMVCSGSSGGKEYRHQFELGKWYEAEGEIELCKNGFHFCVHPSGVWSYYSEAGTRVFKIEAEQVLDVPVEPGADFKLVCKRIRLVEEVLIGGNWNTGDSNTGNWNTGNWNTGDSNTGHRNTGNWNTGDSNTGHRNTGNWNTGDRNTGNWNTGDRNTGDRNTGNWNTGNWNTGDRVSGFFCAKEPRVISFDVQTKFTHGQFLEKYPESWALGELLSKPEKIDFERFKNIPGITRKKLLALHAKHLEAKKK